MLLFKTRPQIEYIDVGGHKEIRIRAEKEAGKDLTSSVPFNCQTEEDMLAIKKALGEYLKQHKNLASNTCDVVLTTDKQYTAMLLLPHVSQSKIGIFVKNDLQDKFGEKYEDKFVVFTQNSKYNKDGMMSRSILIEKKVIKESKKAVESVGLKVKGLCPLGVLEAEEEAKSGVFPSNCCSLAIDGSYISVDIYAKSILADTFVLPFSMDIYKGKSESERFTERTGLFSRIDSAIGRQQFAYSKSTVEKFIAVSSDKQVGEELLKDNPLELPYTVSDYPMNSFDHRFFKKIPRAFTHQVLTSAYTLVEVVVSLAVLGVFVGLVTGIVIGMNNLNTKTLAKEKASFYIDQVDQRYQVPNDLKTVLGSSVDLTVGKDVYVTFADGIFSATQTEPKSYEFVFSYVETTLVLNNAKTSYTLTLNNIHNGNNIFYSSQIIKAIR
jgi:type II secretory pathway pseudopilin PulG